MKIALVGYGKMGKEVESVAREKGHEIVAIIDPSAENATAKTISKDSLNGADVAIEFTSPAAVLNNIKQLTDLQVPVVVGTTGWYDKIDSVRSDVEAANASLVYGSNFSVGVNLFFRIVAHAAHLVDNVPEYDVFGYELHHKAKADSPSGTAESIASLLKNNISRKKNVQYDRVNRPIQEDELHFASVRAGSIPGTHVVGFDSAADTIELKHTARNRSGFALGAVLAAQWLIGKNGFFTVDDFMNDVLGGP